MRQLFTYSASNEQLNKIQVIFVSFVLGNYSYSAIDGRPCLTWRAQPFPYIEVIDSGAIESPDVRCRYPFDAGF